MLSACGSGQIEETADAVSSSTTRPVAATASDYQTEIINSTDRLTDLIDWAFGRFELAGIRRPDVVSITFSPFTLCRDHLGSTTTIGKRAYVILCFGGGECETDDERNECSAFARHALLHELGHAWTNTYLNDDDRAEFRELRGLEHWSGSNVPYLERGTEHAAEVLAWGLLEECPATVRLPDSTCDTLAAAFQFLTGAEPLLNLNHCDPSP
jgi:hypothetical protein